MGYTLDGLYAIKDLVIVVTGASGGIGSEICKAILDLGGIVAAVVRSETSTEKLLTALGRDYSEDRLYFAQADLTDEAQVRTAMADIFHHFGRIDGLVNAGGMNIIEALDDITMADFSRVMDTNFTALVMSCKYAGHYMLQAGRGRIVNLSSLSAIKGKPFYTAYAASKAAVDSFTRALAIEWARKGINVNAVAPSIIVTEINRRQIESNPESYEKRISNIPRGCPGRPEWLISPIIMLLSPGAVHLTGTTLFVDGGCSAGDCFIMEKERFDKWR